MSDFYGSHQVPRSEVRSITPQAWANMLQPPLRKSLVSAAVTNYRFDPNLKIGDTLHFSYFSGDNTVVSYTPFDTITNHETMETTGEQLQVDTKPLLRKQVDNIEELYTNLSAQVELADEAAYALKDYMDQDILSQVLNANDALFDADLTTIDGDNVINMMTTARKELREANVEDGGDWISIITPAIAEQIELKATDKGFQVADATLRNGHAGPFVGYNIYISNNLPEVVELSSSEVASGEAFEDYDSGDVVSETAYVAAYDQATYDAISSSRKGHACYFGKKGMIHTAFKAQPSMEMKDIPDSLGKYLYFYTVYGTKTFDKYSRRFMKAYLRA